MYNPECESECNYGRNIRAGAEKGAASPSSGMAVAKRRDRRLSAVTKLHYATVGKQLVATVCHPYLDRAFSVLHELAADALHH